MEYTDPRFHAAVVAALQPLSRSARVTGTITPYDQPPNLAASRISTDRRSILASVELKETYAQARSDFNDLMKQISSPRLRILPSGVVAVGAEFDQFSKSDLSLAEAVSLPVALILLLLVFGTVIAALLCLGVGVLAVVGGLGGVYALTHFMDVSTYALNICTLVGLGVAIDYSLFIASRFREELRTGSDPQAALEVAMVRAGRAVLFSGLTVALCLSGL